MKKYTVLIVWCFIAGLLLFGCGDAEVENTKNPVAQSKSGRITIIVNDGPSDTEPYQVAKWDLKVDMFEKKYPDMMIEVQDWEYEPQVFITRAAGGLLSDVIGTWATEGEILITNQLIADMTKEITSWKDFKHLRPIILQPFHRNQKYYAFPMSAYSMGLFYNKKIFREAGVVDEDGGAKPPETWEEFVETAKKIKNAEKGISGFSILGGHHARAGWHFLNWGWQGGGDFEVKEDGRWKAAFDGPGVVRALQFIKDLKWKHDVLQENVLEDQTDIMQNFAAGRVGMFIEAAHADALIALREQYEFDLADLGIAPLPEGPGGRFVQMGADYLCFRPDIPENKRKAAFQWCVFNVSNEWKKAEVKLRKEHGLPVGAPYVPVFTGERLKQWEEIIEKERTIPEFKEYKDVVKYLRTEPPYYCQQLYREVLGPAVQEVLTKEDADPKEILSQKADMFQDRYLDEIEEVHKGSKKTN